MELSIRLLSIVEMMNISSIVADIGTDHGYIPIHLIKNNICSKVIATDISKGSLLKAKRNVENEGLSEFVEFRKGNGFGVLQEGEAQSVIISGMGGNLIKEIILDKINIVKNIDFILLQPIQNPEVLRRFLIEYGFKIFDEDLCFDEGKYYEIFKVKFDTMRNKLDEIYYEISPILLEKRHPLLKKYMEYKISKYEKVLTSIDHHTEISNIKVIAVKDRISGIKELLKCLY